jgi:hypothetical protein
LLGLRTQKLAERGDVERMVAGSEGRQVFPGQFKEAHCGPQAAAVLGVHGVLEILLEMNERTGSLDQALKKIIIVGVGIEPKVLENVVRFIISLFVPTAEEGPIKRMICDVSRRIDVHSFEVAHETRNPLAFVHEELNLIAAQMVGKLRPFTFFRGRLKGPREFKK